MPRQLKRLLAAAFIAAALLAARDVSSQEPIPSALRDFAGTWSGTYICAQGVTGLTLVVDPRNGDAVFSFYPIPKNPDVASGEFTMSGHVDAKSEQFVLEPGGWRDRPPGYFMVGLIGHIDAVTRHFIGAVRSTSSSAPCRTFDLRRAATTS
jgi:hypothetical protein